jgi:hypothetical protein
MVSAENIPSRPLKVVFVGNSQVGKTTMFMKLMFGVADSSYPRTLGVFADFIMIDGKRCGIWDTAGHEPFYGLRGGYYFGGDVFFIFPGGEGKTIEEWDNDIREIVPNALIIVTNDEMQIRETIQNIVV